MSSGVLRSCLDSPQVQLWFLRGDLSEALRAPRLVPPRLHGAGSPKPQL